MPFDPADKDHDLWPTMISAFRVASRWHQALECVPGRICSLGKATTISTDVVVLLCERSPGSARMLHAAARIGELGAGTLSVICPAELSTAQDVPLTALWIAVNLAFPALGASGVPIVTSRLAIHVMIALGLWLGLERAELTPSQRRNVWLAVMIPFTLWLAVVWSAAINGFFKPGGAIPVLPLAALGPVIIGAPILLRSRRIGQVLDAMPASWLVALQVFRVLGSTFLVGWAYGVVPGVFALPAGIGDVLTGLFAVPAAISLASGSRESRRAAVAWNVFGLADFATALSIGIAIGLHVIETGFASATGGLYPVAMIPAFAVPSSIMLHALSLRQLWRRGHARRI